MPTYEFTSSYPFKTELNPRMLYKKKVAATSEDFWASGNREKNKTY
jgi:hypothetical protein